MTRAEIDSGERGFFQVNSKQGVPPPLGLIHLFFAENCPWCLWVSLDWRDYARWGEWAWVGREYEL